MKGLSDINEFPEFAVYDVEAALWVNVLCICHVDEDGTRRSFDSTEEYVSWLFDEWEGSFVWAHWGGHYDHRFVLHEIHKRAEYLSSTGQGSLDFEIVLSGNLIIILKVVLPDGRTIRFCESARIMPDSVERIGKSIGLHKLDADVKHAENIPRDKLLEYCFRDCDIILKALCTVRDELKAEGIDFAYTLASMATRLIRRSDILDFRRFYEEDLERPGKIKQRRDFWAADSFSCAAYFGGMTQAFVTGKLEGPFWLYDIRSSYPASMTYPIPAYFKEFRAGPMNGVTTRAQLATCGITYAEVNIPEGSMPIPLLPIRITKHEQEVLAGTARAEGRCMLCGIILLEAQRAAKDDRTGWVCERCERDPVPMVGGKILYIEGRMRGRWTNLELLTLYDHMRNVPGFYLKILCQAIYVPKAFLKPFVDKFWVLRQKAIELTKSATTDDERARGEFKKYVYKILMNAVSGKLAEQITKTKVVYGRAVNKARREKNADGTYKHDVRPTSVPGIWVIEHLAEGAFRHAAAAAYVTGRSRVWLWEALMTAHQQGARVLYCDTDSIIVDKPIFGEASNESLGSWHLEHKIARIEIFAPKVYRFETIPELCKACGKVHSRLFYKAKGMPIERRENKGEPRKTEDVWLDFTQRFQDSETTKKRAENSAGYYPRDKPMKEGINGLLRDLNDSNYKSAAPRAFALKRMLQNTDKKRRHEAGSSKPLYQDRIYRTKVRNFGRVLEADTPRAKPINSGRRKNVSNQ